MKNSGYEYMIKCTGILSTNYFIFQATLAFNPFDAVKTNLSRELTRILQFIKMNFSFSYRIHFLTKCVQSIVGEAKIR